MKCNFRPTSGCCGIWRCRPLTRRSATPSTRRAQSGGACEAAVAGTHEASRSRFAVAHWKSNVIGKRRRSKRCQMSIDVPHQMPYFHETYENFMASSHILRQIKSKTLIQILNLDCFFVRKNLFKKSWIPIQSLLFRNWLLDPVSNICQTKIWKTR